LDFYQSLRGKMVVVFNELASMGNAEIENIKSIVSKKVDTYRQSYGRDTADYKRQCVFGATTNKETPLKDETGGRRFWPVRVGIVKIADLTRDREQLFAEAVHRYKEGEKWHEMPLLDTAAEQEASRESDAWESAIAVYLDNRAVSETTIPDIARDVFTIELGNLNIHDSRRIGRIVRFHGWEQKTVRHGSRVLKVFVPSEAEKVRRSLFEGETP